MMLDHADRIGSFVSERWTEITEIDGLGVLIRAQGLNLDVSGADPGSIDRGTPLYVDESADASRVLRRMAEAHVRFLFVIRSTDVVGVVDIREIVERAAGLVWPVAATADSQPGDAWRDGNDDSIP
jgi:CBS domain containing-hemolysin-like protein